MELALPAIIAHRGAPRLAPENTLPALEIAKAQGASWVEFDTMLTQDNVPIVFHDNSLYRITKLKKKVANTPYATIATLDAGRWLDKRFSDTRIPTLESYVMKAAQLNLGMNIEMKATSGKEEQLAGKIIQLLEKHWSSNLPQPLLSSFSVENLIALKNLHCPYPIAYNTDAWHDCCREIAVALDCYSIHMEKSKVNKKRVHENQAKGLKTVAYTVNSTHEAKKLLRLGVTAIISDLPDLICKGHHLT